MPRAAAGTRWLVTGADGQLGRSVRAVASACGVEAVGRTHEELDITDAEAVAGVLEETQPAVLLNCAAFTKVDLCEERPEDAMLVNGQGPGILARAAAGRTLLVHLSSETVFAGDGNVPLKEDAEPEPLSAYGRSKLSGEQAVRAAGGEHLIVRTQWVFGPGPNFVRTILAAAKRGESLRVVEDQLGRPTWTGDLARGLLHAVAAGARGTLHLAGEGVASWYDLASAIVAEGMRRGAVPKVEVRPVRTVEMPRPAQRPMCALLGLERARGIGLHLMHWREALAAYLDAEEEGRDA